MNKLSGYRLFRLEDGTEVELKFANGTYELFAGLMGLDTLEEIDAALKPPVKLVDDGNGGTKEVPTMTLGFLKAFRLYVLAAAQYAARVQNKPDDFTEGQVMGWIDEIGIDQIFAVMEPASTPTEEAKKKPKDRVKPTQ